MTLFSKEPPVFGVIYELLTPTFKGTLGVLQSIETTSKSVTYKFMIFGDDKIYNHYIGFERSWIYK